MSRPSNVVFKLFMVFQSVRHELTIVSCSRLTKWTRKWRTAQKKTIDRETQTGRSTRRRRDSHALGSVDDDIDGGHTHITLLIFAHRFEHLIFFLASLKCDSKPKKTSKRRTPKMAQQTNVVSDNNIESHSNAKLGVMCTRTKPIVIAFVSHFQQFSIAINKIIDETFWLQIAWTMNRWMKNGFVTFKRWAKVTTFK